MPLTGQQEDAVMPTISPHPQAAALPSTGQIPMHSCSMDSAAAASNSTDADHIRNFQPHLSPICTLLGDAAQHGNAERDASDLNREEHMAASAAPMGEVGEAYSPTAHAGLDLDMFVASPTERRPLHSGFASQQSEPAHVINAEVRMVSAAQDESPFEMVADGQASLADQGTATCFTDANTARPIASAQPAAPIPAAASVTSPDDVTAGNPETHASACVDAPALRKAIAGNVTHTVDASAIHFNPDAVPEPTAEQSNTGQASIGCAASDNLPASPAIDRVAGKATALEVAVANAAPGSNMDVRQLQGSMVLRPSLDAACASEAAASDAAEDATDCPQRQETEAECMQPDARMPDIKPATNLGKTQYDLWQLRAIKMVVRSHVRASVPKVC